MRVDEQAVRQRIAAALAQEAGGPVHEVVVLFGPSKSSALRTMGIVENKGHLGRVWAGCVYGSAIVTAWGKVQAPTFQSHTKPYLDGGEARREFEKLISEKLGGGYCPTYDEMVARYRAWQTVG